MPGSITNHEIIHHIVLLSLKSDVKIIDGIIDLYRKRGIPRLIALQEARRRLKTIEDIIDNNVRVSVIKRIKPYYQRCPKRVNHLIQIKSARKYKWTPLVQEKITSLSPREFEILIGNLLVIRDCNELIITPRSHDAGFDFIGKINLGAKMKRPKAFYGISLLDEHDLYLFGQVKRYHLKCPIGPGSIQSLVGSIDMLNKGGGTKSIDKLIIHLQAWGWRPFSPLFPVFITSSRFTKEMPGLAFKQKFLFMDGEQLSQRIIQESSPIRNELEIDSAIMRLTQKPKRNVILI